VIFILKKIVSVALMDGIIEIIRLFSKDPAREITINQISKEIKKSYSFTNKNARQMIDEGILNKKIVGPSILCSLNCTNEMTKALLCLVSVQKKNEFISKNPSKAAIEDIVSKTKEHSDFIFSYENSIYIVTDSSVEKTKATVISKKEFSLKKFDISKMVLLWGYDKFWELLGDKNG
jgi:hypothetical protein